eukprot:4553463-Alexandrium_andersonii.AAC.1
MQLQHQRDVESLMARAGGSDPGHQMQLREQFEATQAATRDLAAQQLEEASQSHGLLEVQLREKMEAARATAGAGARAQYEEASRTH